MADNREDMSSTAVKLADNREETSRTAVKLADKVLKEFISVDELDLGGRLGWLI